MLGKILSSISSAVWSWLCFSSFGGWLNKQVTNWGQCNRINPFFCPYLSPVANKEINTIILENCPTSPPSPPMDKYKSWGIFSSKHNRTLILFWWEKWNYVLLIIQVICPTDMNMFSQSESKRLIMEICIKIYSFYVVKLQNWALQTKSVTSFQRVNHQCNY